MDSEFESPYMLDPVSQVDVVIGTLLLLVVTFMSFLIESPFSDSTKEVPTMDKNLFRIILATKSILAVSVNIGANLLVSTCMGS